jgi:hypothetical protein
MNLELLETRRVTDRTVQQNRITSHGDYSVKPQWPFILQGTWAFGHTTLELEHFYKLVSAKEPTGTMPELALSNLEN